MKELWNRLWHDPATVRKFIVALLTAITIAVSNGLLPPEVSNWVEVVLPFLGAVGVYRVWNKPDRPLNNSVTKGQGK